MQRTRFRRPTEWHWSSGTGPHKIGVNSTDAEALSLPKAVDISPLLVEDSLSVSAPPLINLQMATNLLREADADIWSPRLGGMTAKVTTPRHFRAALLPKSR